jgi:hypothetical protein
MSYEFHTCCWIGIPTVFWGSAGTWDEGGRQQARCFNPVGPCAAPQLAMPRWVSQKGEDSIDKDQCTTANGAVGRRRLGPSVPLIKALVKFCHRGNTMIE